MSEQTGTELTGQNGIKPTVSQEHVLDDSLASIPANAIKTDNTDEVLSLETEEAKLDKVWYHLISKPNSTDIEYSSNNNNTPMTSHNEILGWILYDMANSPYQQVGIALVVTLFITTNATTFACMTYHDNGCDINGNPIQSNDDIIVYVGRSSFKPESFYFFIFSVFGGVQLIGYLGIGGLSDYGYYQYYIFMISSLTGAVSNLGYAFFSKPGSWQIAGWWAGATNTLYSLASIAYNANLVDIANNHWLIRRGIRINASQKRIIKLTKSILDDISQFGFCAGYLGSLFMTIIALVIIAVFTKPFKYNTDNYGITTDTTKYEEYYAKPVSMIDISYAFNDNHGYITSLQFIYDYDGHTIIGDTFGEHIPMNISGYTYNNELLSINSDQINEVNLWLNNDNTLSGIQFKSDNMISNVFGMNNSDTTTIKPTDKFEGFLLQGYQGYSKYSNNINRTIISGMDFLFVNPTSQYENTFPLQLCMIVVFIWWFSIELITVCTMKKRRKPSIPSNSTVYTVSFKDFYYTLKDARKYPEIIKYLIAWFFFSDALATSSTLATLFARVEIGLTSFELALTILEVELFAVLGAWFHLWLQRRLQWNCKQMLLYHIISYMVILLYAAIGTFNAIPIGLKTRPEMFIFAILYGFHFGSIQGYARALASNLIPSEKENKIFAVIAITDRGSSWIGPLITTVVTNWLGLRFALFYLVIFFLIGGIITYYIDLDKGIKQSGKLNEYNDDDINTNNDDDTHGNTTDTNNDSKTDTNKIDNDINDEQP